MMRISMSDGGHEPNNHVILLACGTRGDVQPLALLAARLHAAQGTLRVDFVTHAAHKEWLPVSNGIQYHWLPQPSARMWANAAAPAERNAGIRAALLECCMTLGQARGWDCRRIILCNLFSLEGFHLAEKLDCRCMVLSPCIVPYAAPTSFERRFRATFPQLYRRLQDSSPGEVGWGEVEHWMWPLFAESWQQWRQEVLNLAPVPFLAAAQRGDALPPATPLLYGLPEQIVPRPGFWPGPDSVRMCGFWLDTQAGAPLSKHLGQDVADFVAAGSTVAVDLGSMPRMGFVPDAAGFVAALRGALRAANLRGLLLTGSYQPLAQACKTGANDDDGDDVLRAVADVPHSLLLPHCCAVVHHGGAGTTAAALTAGCPQLVSPLHFDQFSWAERVEDLGAGLQLQAAQQLLAGTGTAQGRGALQDQLAAQLRRIIQPAYRSRCSHIAADLRGQPGGLQIAAQHILHDIASSNAAKSEGLAAATLPSTLPPPAAGQGSDDGHGSDGAAGRTADAQIFGEAQLCELAPGFSLFTSCPNEARFIYDEVFAQRCYLRHGITLGASDIVIDCGANIGLFTLQLLLATPAPSVVVAAEPLPPNLALLHRNLALHAAPVARSGCDVRVLPLAMGAASCSRKFTYYPSMPGNSTALPGEKALLQAPHMPAARFADQQTWSCPVTSVSRVICQEELERVDLLKVDAEGMELEVLAGVAPENWPCIRQVVAEVHDVVEAGGSRLAQVQALLQSHTFECRVEPTVPEGNVLVYAVRRAGIRWR